MKNINCFASTRGLLSAFTLAEMMVVMLILSIVLAAMAPVMTTRNKPNNSSPWQYEANSRQNAYFGAGANMYAMIGKTTYDEENWDHAKLLIATGGDDDTTNMLAFMKGDTKLGRLYIGSNNGLLLGSSTANLGSNANAVGRGVEASGNNSTAFGYSAKASGADSTAVGSSVTASGTNSITIGQGGNATAENSLAIGKDAKAESENSIAIGKGTTVRDAGSSYPSTGTIAIGSTNNTVNGDGTIAIGYNVTAQGRSSHNTGKSVIAIGKGATAEGDYSLAIGEEANAHGFYCNRDSCSSVLAYNWGYSAIAIGKGAEANIVRPTGSAASAERSWIVNTMAIGTASKAKSGNALALGMGAEVGANSSGSIAIGSKATATTEATASSSVLGSSIAIGRYSLAKGGNSIAIGSASGDDTNSYVPVSDKTQALGGYSIAIGYKAKTDDLSESTGYYGGYNHYNGAIAIGYNASAVGDSVAIGRNAKADKKRQVVLGTANDTVYIPGNLVVGKYSVFGYSDKQYRSYFRFKTYNKDNWWFKSFNVHDGDNNDLIWGEEYEGVVDGFPKPETSSDRRLKYVGKENTSGLDKIRQLKVFNYTYKKDITKTPHVGVIAQDLQKVFPDAVKKGADGFLTIRMEDMFFAVINAIKELDAKYQTQEKRITALEKENKEFKARLDRLEAKTK